MFVCAERVDAEKALQFGLVDGIAKDPVADAVLRIETGYAARER
jgi:enoyl-CoA hydratase/carnithine racemase